MPAPQSSTSRALFLDVDGTLLAIAPTPAGVRVPDALKILLADLQAAHGGAVALVSGRPIAQLDELFFPLRLPCAGLHGLERRDSAGRRYSLAPDPAVLKQMRVCLTEFTARHRGTLLEDKGATLALHYRQAPHWAAAARQAIESAGLPEHWELMEGKCVLELKPSALSKATAIADFMREPPFAGRKAVFAGDDRTDERGFEYVNAIGGESIHVGTAQTCARSTLPDISALHRWLETLRDRA